MSEKEDQKRKRIIKWKVDFEMEETLPETEETATLTFTLTQHQREITHTIGRAIGSIAAQCGPSLRITDWHTRRDGVEQPEAAAIDTMKEQSRNSMKDI
jgi:hypothetical protein